MYSMTFIENKTYLASVKPVLCWMLVVGVYVACFNMHVQPKSLHSSYCSYW